MYGKRFSQENAPVREASPSLADILPIDIESQPPEISVNVPINRIESSSQVHVLGTTTFIAEMNKQSQSDR